MKTIRIQLIAEEDSLTVSEDSLGLGQNGWLPGLKERLSILTTGSLNDVMGLVLKQYDSLFGDGELVFTTTSTEGRPDVDPNGTPCTAYQGYILFIPKEEELNMPKIDLPKDTPQDIADFLTAHWGDFRKMARAVEPDSVLIAWTGQSNFMIHAVPRTKIIEEDPESVPPAAQLGPPELAPGAEMAIWASICTKNDDDVRIAWCALNFYPEAQA